MNDEIIGIYLAAGKSSRMGVNKLQLPFQHMPLGSMALRVAIHSKLDKTFVITNSHDPLNWIHQSLFLQKEKWVHLPCHESSLGQSNSLKYGIQKAQEEKATAAVILLADQPFIRVDIINHLIDQYYQNKNYDYIASSYLGIVRPPILFSAPLFNKLSQLKGDEGARQLLRSETTINMLTIPFENEKYFFDVDTIDDYIYALEMEGRI